ncbi:MAG TPA: sigma-E factor regulatory protein RseB domain-containing protein [Armatimonadota bacterium]|nr:sigma-E factor regulatory protein RseB domain-containing protein [Armatimonadota bacterium]
MKPCIAIFSLLLIFFAGAGLADSTPWQAVWDSETATEEITMTGRATTMTVNDGRSLSATAAVTAARGKVRFDYQADGRRWSLIDDGTHLIQLRPHRKTALLLERPTLAVDRTLAERNYVAREGGEAVIAGRPARVIEIAPREGGPLLFRLWLDRKTHFALKRERHNIEGRLTSGTEYTEVQFGPTVAPDVFAVPEGWAARQPADREAKLSLGQLSARLGFALRSPQYLPPGYVLLGGYEQGWGRHRLRMAELRYTDGLRMLSLFQRERTGEEGAGGRGGRGRGHGRGRDEGGRGGGGGFGFGPPGREDMTLIDRGTEKALRYFGRNAVVVVVGDLAAEELVRMAKSVD